MQVVQSHSCYVKRSRSCGDSAKMATLPVDPPCRVLWVLLAELKSLCSLDPLADMICVFWEELQTVG